jgi:hypothetical protein
MAIDPSIALGVKPLEIANPLAQYGQIAQLQAAQNQNQLAQYQLGAAQRAEAKDVARTNMLAQAGTDDTAIANALLKSGDIKGYQEFVKSRRETQKADVDLVDAKLKQSRSFLETINPADPNAPAQYIAWHEANHKDPVLGPALAARGVTADQSRARIAQAIQSGPQAFAELLNQSKLGTEKFMEMNKPHFVTQDTGAGGRTLALPGLGGASAVVPGTEFTKTQTFADRNAAARLAFDQNKFAWEKANPGYELKEDADGNMFGVNKRTLQAVPVTVGGGAPASAPAVSGAGMPGPRVAQPGVVPAIPGMTSVLDQAAPAAAPATGVRQLTGKGTALTESQGNAAAYGMRMKEANSILLPLEKAGVKNTGLVSGAVGSTLGIVPLIGDKLEGMSGSVFNALPQILGGLSPEQQQVAQARINFITAVLRKESGASISPGEFTTAEKNYFPKPGDDASVVAQKQKARDLAIKAMGIQAGPGAKNIEQFVPSGNAAAPTVSNW